MVKYANGFADIFEAAAISTYTPTVVQGEAGCYNHPPPLGFLRCCNISEIFYVK